MSTREREAECGRTQHKPLIVRQNASHFKIDKRNKPAEEITRNNTGVNLLQ